MPRIIDLTLTLTPEMRGVAFEPKYRLPQDAWNATTLHLYSHCGTHMDAPIHYEAGDQSSIDQVPLAQCMGPAWVVDLTGIAPKALIEVASLGKISEQFRPGDSLLLRTGWSAFLHASKYRDELPRISRDLARWCVAQGVKMLGVEPPAVADVNNREEVGEVHRILLGGNVRIIEGLTRLDALQQEKVFLVALPIKWQGGDGAPVRALAIEGIPADGWLGGAPS